MKITFHFLSLFLFVSIFSFAQEEKPEKPKYGWQKEAIIALNMTQSSFDNYVQGGENTTAWQFRLAFKFDNNQEKFAWLNSGKLEYGRTKTGNQDDKKSVDEIKFESVLKYNVAKLINPFIGFNGETQFAAGYDYSAEPKIEVSNLFDPAYFRESAGMSYAPNEIINARLGAALKQTITNKHNSWSNDPETTETEKLKNEIGVDCVVDLNYKIAENNLLVSKIELFSNVKSFDEIDVIWNTDLTSKITKYISFNFNVKLLYDKDISTKRQLKQVMGLGISYSFF